MLRPEGNSQYLVLGDTGNHLDPCDGRRHTYPVNIAVQPGDVLGVFVFGQPWWDDVLAKGSVAYQGGQFEPAASQTITVANTLSGFQVDESATLRRK